MIQEKKKGSIYLAATTLYLRQFFAPCVSISYDVFQSVAISVFVFVVIFRTATDFASAMDGIWPFFAAAGCRRTTKAQLINMDIVKKVGLQQP